MARRRRARLDSVERLRVLGAPATLEVLDALRSDGPASVTELGPRLARKANSLHYHVRKLARLGLIRAVDSRRSGARTEQVWDVVAERFEGADAPRDPELRAATDDAVASLLRQAAREYARAAEHVAAHPRSAERQALGAERCKAWLDADALAAVRGHLQALVELFGAHREPGPGRACALTYVLTPLVDDDAARRSPSRSS